jgi:hypothetical protein
VQLHPQFVFFHYFSRSLCPGCFPEIDRLHSLTLVASLFDVAFRLPFEFVRQTEIQITCNENTIEQQLKAISKAQLPCSTERGEDIETMNHFSKHFLSRNASIRRPKEGRSNCIRALKKHISLLNGIKICVNDSHSQMSKEFAIQPRLVVTLSTLSWNAAPSKRPQ